MPFTVIRIQTVVCDYTSCVYIVLPRYVAQLAMGEGEAIHFEMRMKKKKKESLEKNRKCYTIICEWKPTGFLTIQK